MARGRMVNKKISNSKRVNDLSLRAQLLFTWLIPHLDCNGCFYGSPQMVKSLVVPRKNWTKSDIKKALDEMEKSLDSDSGQPLIRRYYVQNDEYLFMPGFVDEQIGLRRDKEKPEFPTFDGNNTESVGQTVPLSRTGRGRGRGREVEDKDKDTPLNPPVSQFSEQQIIEAYEENILHGGIVSEEMEHELKIACGRYSPGWVNDAMKESLLQNQPSWRYIVGILNNWQKHGKPRERVKEEHG